MSSTASAFDGLLQTVLPCLKSLIDDLCEHDSHKRSVKLAMGLLEHCGAPAQILTDLLSWSTLQDTPPLVTTNGHIVKPPPPAAPGEEKGSGSPKKKQAVKPVVIEDGTDSGNASALKRPGGRMGSRKVSIWRAREAESDDEAISDEDPAGLIRGSVVVAARKSTGASPRARSSARMSEGGAVVKDYKRRFSVAVSQFQLPLPPEGETLRLLRQVPHFSRFSDKELQVVAGIAKCRRYEPGENIMSHGGPVDQVQIVVEGAGKMAVPYQIGNVGPGDYFGEEALNLATSTSMTEISACRAPVTTISVSASDFSGLDLGKKWLLKRSQSKCARVKVGTLAAPTTSDGGRSDVCEDSGQPIQREFVQTAADRDLIIMAVKNNPMLGEVLELTEEQCNLIADSVYLISVDEGKMLIKKGDQGMALYIVQEGLLNVILTPGVNSGIVMRPGESFGELSLLYDTPRATTITAAKDCKLWVLSRYDYKLVTSLAYKSRIEEYSEFLSKIPCLTDLVKPTDMDMLADVLEKVTFYDQEELCAEGEDDGVLFIIYNGECEVHQDGECQRILKRGDWIGEEQLIQGCAADSTVIPTSNQVTALLLDSSNLHTVTKVLEQMQHSRRWCMLRTGVKLAAAGRSSIVESNPYIDHVEKEKFADEYLKKRIKKSCGKKKFERKNSLDDCEVEPAIENMQKVGALGEGAFGCVLMMEDTNNGSTYALKALSKAHITKENMGRSIQNERSVMMLLESEFIVRLHQSYQDRTNIFFLMEAVTGGELFDVYNEKDLFGKFDLARFYIGCVTLGLQHMHVKRVVYRDLKLENCLLDGRGYLKLADMGIAKVVIGKTYTVCGTADYFAPETLKQVGHDRGVDWWACGILLFIMATGWSPFDAPKVMQTYKNIIKGFSKVKIPDNLPSDLTDTVKSLCRKNPEERVTMQKGGVQNLQTMPFFSSFSWQELELLAMEAPFVPPELDLDKVRRKKLSREIEVCTDTIQEWDGSLPESVGSHPESTPE